MSLSILVGRSTVSPCLLVENIQDELRFLEAVFGAEVSQRRAGNESTLWQVEARLGNAILMIGRAQKDNTPTTGMLYVLVEDVDATYARAVEQGATLISAPTDQPSGVREAGFRDPQGNIWWIGKQVSRPSNREVERRLAEQRRKRL
ncbi:MAG: VOC family protein [Chloroflexota bacterium]